MFKMWQFLLQWNINIWSLPREILKNIGTFFRYDLFGEGYIEIYPAIGMFLNDRVQQLS